jgi:flagellar hook-associated protein 1 FlgK
MVSGLGNEASLIYSEQRSSESLVNQIQDRIRSISSVSLDEEMTNMLRYQQAYQASARVISVARDMADAVFQLV